MYVHPSCFLDQFQVRKLFAPGHCETQKLQFNEPRLTLVLASERRWILSGSRRDLPQLNNIKRSGIIRLADKFWSKLSWIIENILFSSKANWQKYFVGFSSALTQSSSSSSSPEWRSVSVYFGVQRLGFQWLIDSRSVFRCSRKEVHDSWSANSSE